MTIMRFVLLDDQLVEVTIGISPGSRQKGTGLEFRMVLAENPDEALAEYGYQSRDDVPVAHWQPMGIEAKK